MIQGTRCAQDVSSVKDVVRVRGESTHFLLNLGVATASGSPSPQGLPKKPTHGATCFYNSPPHCSSERFGRLFIEYACCCIHCAGWTWLPGWPFDPWPTHDPCLQDIVSQAATPLPALAADELRPPEGCQGWSENWNPGGNGRDSGSRVLNTYIYTDIRKNCISKISSWYLVIWQMMDVSLIYAWYNGVVDFGHDCHGWHGVGDTRCTCDTCGCLLSCPAEDGGDISVTPSVFQGSCNFDPAASNP